MAHEPLRTDEPTAGSPRPRSDFETQLMAGCATIGIASLVTYLLAVWPWFVFPEYRLDGLASIAATGALPATAFGVYATRRFKLAGASGFFGGGMASAVFMYLRLDQTMLGRLAVDLPSPEYPERWAWLVPAAWFLWTGLVAALALPRGEAGEAEPGA